MPMPRKLAISRKFEKKPMYRTSAGIQRMSSSSTKRIVLLTRTRRVRLPRRRSNGSNERGCGSDPGSGPVDISGTVAGRPGTLSTSRRRVKSGRTSSRRAARTAALGGSQHRPGSVATWARVSLAFAAREHGQRIPPGRRRRQVSLQVSQPRVQLGKAGDAIRDRGSAHRDQGRKGRARVRAVAGVAPRRDPRRVLERHVQPTQVDQQAQVLHVRLGVLAVRVPCSRGSWQPTGSLVEANRVRRHADPAGQLAYAHHRSKPWSASNVKA